MRTPLLLTALLAVACAACGGGAPSGTTPSDPASEPSTNVGTSGADDGDDGDDGPDDVDDDTPAVASTPRAGTPGDALHAEAVRELGAMKSTAYRHVTHIDESRGVFEYDCSGFVNYALKHAAPEGLTPLHASAKRPKAKTYVEVIGAIPPAMKQGAWTHLPSPDTLKPGDVVAWRAVAKKKDFLGKTNTGHVMIVDAVPTRNGDTWVVPIIDSSGGHGGADPRKAPDATGLGRGNVYLVTDGDRVIGFRWKETSALRKTNVVLGRVE